MYKWTFKTVDKVKTNVESSVYLCALWLDTFITANAGKDYIATIERIDDNE